MMNTARKTPEQVGRNWADDRWNNVYPWRHEKPFTRPEYDDEVEAERLAKCFGLPQTDCYQVLATARARWDELQRGGDYGRYARR